MFVEVKGINRRIVKHTFLHFYAFNIFCLLMAGSLHIAIGNEPDRSGVHAVEALEWIRWFSDVLKKHLRPEVFGTNASKPGFWENCI